MIVEKKDDRIYLKSELLEKNGIKHTFTTAEGGASRGKVFGLNLGFRVGDDIDAVRENYAFVAHDMDFDAGRITSARQTHSANVRVVGKAEAGFGVMRDGELENTDGMVTGDRGIALVVFYADCVPILLADKKAGVVAAVHSGWRGTAARISENAVHVMCEKFGAKPENIVAAVGPSIGPCCFECGEDTLREFDERFHSKTSKNTRSVDLWRANRAILEEAGLKSENIEVFEMCTVCERDMRLYSYRRQREATGRMGAFIEL